MGEFLTEDFIVFIEFNDLLVADNQRKRSAHKKLWKL